MEKDNAIILILLILIAIASCVCIIITGANISLVQPHETNTTDLSNITKNTTNLTNGSNVDIDNTQRDTGVYAPDSSESSSENYYTGQSYQYTPSYDSGQGQSSDSGQGQSSEGGSETPSVDPGQSEQPAETADFE